MSSQKAKRSYKRLSAEEWARAEAYWKSGAHTLEDLSASFGVTTRALQAHFKKYNVAKSSEAGVIAAAAQEQVQKKEIGDLAKRMELSRAAQATTLENADRIEALIMAQIALSERDPEKALICMGRVKMLSLAAATIERIHALKVKTLNVPVDDPQDLPAITFHDLSDEDIEAIRADQATGDDEEDGELADEEYDTGEDEVDLIET